MKIILFSLEVNLDILRRFGVGIDDEILIYMYILNWKDGMYKVKCTTITSFSSN